MNSAPAELLHPLFNDAALQLWIGPPRPIQIDGDGSSALSLAKKNAGTPMPASEYYLQKTSLFSKKTPPSPIESAEAASAFAALTVLNDEVVYCSFT